MRQTIQVSWILPVAGCLSSLENGLLTILRWYAVCVFDASCLTR